MSKPDKVSPSQGKETVSCGKCGHLILRSKAVKVEEITSGLGLPHESSVEYYTVDCKPDYDLRASIFGSTSMQVRKFRKQYIAGKEIYVEILPGEEPQPVEELAPDVGASA